MSGIRFGSAVAGVLLISLIGQGAAADGLPRPAVSYRADIEISAGSVTMSGTTWYTPQKERRELGFKGSKSPRKPVILRRDTSRVLVLNRSAKTFFGSVMRPGENRRVIAKNLVEMVKLGDETRNGVPATKYRATFAGGGGGQVSGFLWLSRDNILLAIDGRVSANGKSRPFKLSLANLKIGPQSDALFEIPKGYRYAAPSRADMGMARGRPADGRPGHGHR